MGDVNRQRGNNGCQVNFVSWNVKALNNIVKRKKVLTHLKNLNTDIAFLQETHLCTVDQFRLKGGWIGQAYHSNFNSKARGVAILISKNIPFVMSSVESDSKGRYVIVVGKLYGFPIILADVYAPNFDDKAFIVDFFSRLPNMDTHHLILGTDANCVLSQTLDRSSPKSPTLSNMAKSIKLFLKTYGISDVWRFRNPTSRTYSFYSPVHKTSSRIDYLFIDKELLPMVTECEYQARVISDHSPLTMKMCIPGAMPNHRQWRLNSLLLSEEAFVNHIKSEIASFLEHNQTPGMSASTVWESMKAYLRGQIISYTAMRRKADTERLKHLTDSILNLDTQYSHLPSDDVLKQRLTLKMEFDLLSTRKVENLILKSRYMSFEHGEKAGKILAHQLRQKAANQYISTISDQQGTKHTDQIEINSCFRQFYSSLYTSEPPDDQSALDNFFQGLEIPKVNPAAAARLDRDISLDEIIDSIASMQSGKSPGPDGYPSEFFKKFSEQLAPLLLSVFRESLSSQSLPQTMREATISLILKKDKDPVQCGSYRPISLLNTDVKILAKCLALRLELHLPSIISTDQTGFIKNRYSFFNIRRLMNILYSPPSPDVPEIVLSLDSQKAFDRVEYDYLFCTLERFGFGAKFISYIKTLYSSPMAAVRTNSNISSSFRLQRGTRQGCPISPLLFAIAAEPLAIALRQSNEIRGIDRGGREHKLSFYADDLLLYISDPLVSLPKVLELLGKFGNISGYKTNLDKSELMPINEVAKGMSFDSTPFKVSTEKFKYLGIWITHNHKDLYKANFLPLMNSLKEDIKRWDLLPLSLGGRINTIKMSVLPKFLYLFQSIPVFLTKFFFKTVNSLISAFIWSNKSPRIRKSILEKPRPQGGMALPNFIFYYWSANIRALMYWMKAVDGPDVPEWLSLESSSCDPTSLSALLCSKLPPQKPTSYYSSNPIVIQSVKIWNQFRRSFELNDFCLHAPIVRNHMFTPSISDGAFGVWRRGGILTVHDLYIDNVFASFEQLVNKYGIPRSHFFRYLQLRDFVQSQCAGFPISPSASLLDNIFRQGTDFKRLIGRIYELLNLYSSESLDNVKIKWEEDLGEQIPEDNWQEIIRRIHSSSICQRHAVIQFKVVHRLHWCKARLSKFRPDIDPLCDRCKQAPADLFHMFWSCPTLFDFWKSVIDTLSKILDRPLDYSPYIAIFGIVPPETSLNNIKGNVLAFCTLLARRLILFKWKESLPPTYPHWVREVMQFINLERIRYSVRGSISKFYTAWQPFLSFVESMEAETVAAT